ncbi:DUF3139 domain-containing protein [Paenibacillus xanthanilyticus]|uniref:DUF3139 domain-containing protein n=1 Tax=Paenibacillus xanthanilyticus TaxID=1783531 RepID=A0ABV8JYF2_9BACL
MILKRKAALLIIILAVSILSTGCNLLTGPPESEESVKQKVVAHLVSKGYEENEFDIDVKYHKSGEGKFGGPYAINVVFNDEPDVIYNYKYNYKSDNKDIAQSGAAPTNGKDDKNFKHTE